MIPESDDPLPTRIKIAIKRNLKTSWTIRTLRNRYAPVTVAILGSALALGSLFLFLWAQGYWMRTIVVSAHSIGIRTAQAAESAEVIETPKPTYTIEQIVDAVHILESSGGRKDGCVTRGEGVNGFGFAQHGSGDVWNCYKNYAQVRTLVEHWFAEKVPAMGLPTALCYYNTGYQKADCPYYRNFLQVVKS